VLDCLEQGHPPADVRKQLLALGCAPDEADKLVQLGLDRRATSARPSAWAPEDAAVRRCMSIGFLLVITGISTGFLRTQFLPPTHSLYRPLNVFFWAAILVGLAFFLLGLAQSNVRRR
jgi:hypothetical protein